MERREMFKKFKLCAVRKFGEYLNSLGYSYSSSKLNNSINEAKFLDLVFKSKKTNREININFWIFSAWGNFDKSISVFISNKNTTVSIFEILEYNKIPYDITNFSLLNYDGEIDKTLEDLCDYTINILEIHIKEWIQGIRWEDIPFDWEPYK